MVNSAKIVFVARKKRHYESTRIKLDMSFEEALSKLCHATVPDEDDAVDYPSEIKGDEKADIPKNAEGKRR